MSDTQTVPDQESLMRMGKYVRERLDADPTVYRIDTDKADLFAVGDFLTPAECQQLCLMVDASARPSSLHELGYDSGFRTSYSGDLDPRDDLVKTISKRIDRLLGVKGVVGEAIQGQRYEPGQQFKPHNDWFYTTEKYWEGERKRGGQRSWTTMVFLNDVEEGGDTHFIDIGIKIEPKTGVLLAWNNALPDGRPNEATIHAGTPVIKGTKYIITKWYRTRPWK